MNKKQSQTRPPVVAIMGHVDHGKSTLLDYIRKSNTVDSESGGITQHIAAYEVEHKGTSGETKKITFVDTPGHAAFTGMRECGASAADIAILIVSAEDGVKTQTIEAIKTIQDNKVPFIVAINKIDKPGANQDKVKTDLLEQGIYVEGFGGDVSWVAISAKTGTGVDELLETILLLAEMEEFLGTPNDLAQGFVIESHMDPKRGISATLVIKNGSISPGQFIVVGTSIAKTRLIEDFLGNQLKHAGFSAPITVIGFDTLPSAGQIFTTHASKKDAESMVLENAKQISSICESTDSNSEATVPLIIKTDTTGTLEAIQGEISKLATKELCFKVIKSGIGNINESDLHIAMSDEKSIILGFHVGIDKKVADSNDAQNVTIKTFEIIYKLSEWLEAEHEKLRPRKMVEKTTGSVKVLKIFSKTKDKQVVGCKVLEGELSLKDSFKLIRRDNTLGRGVIQNIEQAKSKIQTVKDGEFGMLVECKYEIAPGDTISATVTEEV